MFTEHDETPAPARQLDSLGDPWTAASLPQDHSQHAWLISYIDILLLLTTLLVMLLAWQRHTPEQRIANVPATKIVVPPQSPLPPPTFIPPDTAGIHPGYTTWEAVTLPTTTQPQEDAANAAQTTAPTTSAPAEVSPLPQTSVAPEQDMVATHDYPSEETVAVTDLPEATPDQPLPWEPPDDLKGQVDMTRQDRQIRLEIKDTLLFESASAALKPQATIVLQKLVDLLGRHPGRIAVEGHTDDLPIATARYPSNWELSAARASTVARYLIQHGIAADRVQAIGYADTRPRTANESTDGRARNRRVSLVMYPQQP